MSSFLTALTNPDFWKSRTVLSILTIIITTISSKLIKVNLTEADTKTLIDTLQAVIIGIASIVGVYGRIKAQGPLVPPQ